MLEAVRRSKAGEPLLHASAKLRESRSFVLDCVACSRFALQHAPEELRGDSGFVLEALGRNAHALPCRPLQFTVQHITFRSRSNRRTV